MTRPNHHDDIFDIPDNGGHPFFSNAIDPLLQESIARRMSAETYVQRSLQEAAHYAQQGHNLALTATLAETNNFISHLEISDDTHLEPADHIDLETIREQKESKAQEEFTTDQANTVLRSAQARLQQAARLHHNSITTLPDEDTPGTAFPATTSALLAYTEVLMFHLEAMRTAGDSKDADIFAAEGHNLASQATAATIQHLLDFLVGLQHQRPRSVSKSFLKRATNTAHAALQRFQDAEPDRTRFTPLETHPSLWNTPDLLEYARNAASKLLSSKQENLMIDGTTQQPGVENYLILMRRNGAIYVKRVTDEYPDDVSPDIAVQHAYALLDFAQHPVETRNDQEDALALNQAGQHLGMLATMDFHSIHPHTFQNVLTLLGQVCDNPHTFHRAADIIFSHAYLIKDHYISKQPSVVPAPGTPEQTHAILQSAIDAGLQPGPLRELCGFLQKDPQEYGIPTKEVTWPQVVGLLEETLDINPDRYALETLLNTVGHDPDSDDAALWLDINALDDEDDDEDDYEDDYDTYDHR